jgi:hypothetical protein
MVNVCASFAIKQGTTLPALLATLSTIAIVLVLLAIRVIVIGCILISTTATGE